MHHALCHCCNQNLCRDHFVQHDDLLNSQLNPLTDEVNTLSDRLAAINPNNIINDSHEKLNQWRIDCHKIIDHFYEQKCQELDQYIISKLDKLRTDITDLRSIMSRLIDQQETTKHDINSLTSAIHDLKQNMNSVEQIQLQLKIHPLLVDDRLIQIEKIEKQPFSLINLRPPYHTIATIGASDYSIASNDRYLLLHIDPNLCLIDENLSITKQEEWDYEYIQDMCWSLALNYFILLTLNDIFLINKKTMLIESVQTLQRPKWWICECSDKSLYLSRIEILDTIRIH
ncbi:unnamed protein product [Adineta steineri]|uniref:Uncharacterized protein n=1 Tax=Adineta steineri TaxID=433720 RepID=A0A814DBT3_9BILA|nr:unnamed protein product [Adineta steineri]CAF3900617.1 unnamed protein product [Adineta steineri]